MKKGYTKKSIDRNIERLQNAFPYLDHSPYPNTTSFVFDKIRENYKNLAYPHHPNWEYCIPLEPNVTIKGMTVDIGFHMDEGGLDKWGACNCISGNIVYSNKPEDYGSLQPGIHNVFYKKLLWHLYQLEIFSDEDFLNGLMRFNNVIEVFMRSDLDGFELEKLIDKANKKRR